MDELDDLTWPTACAYMCQVYNYANNLRKCRHLDAELLERMPFPTLSPLVPAIKPTPAAHARPKRERKGVQKAKSPHSLVTLVPDATAVTCQVSKDALAMMHLHAFLCHSEVIGWLGGSVTGDSITIADAFPVRAMSDTENPNINVEMDPEDAYGVKETMQKQGLAIVGWYHSHPTFENTPSIVDIENQQSQQKSSENRFLGAIISPYWSPPCSPPSLPPVCTFTVEEDHEHFVTYDHHPPCEVRHSIYSDPHTSELLPRAKDLICAYTDHPRRINFKAVWRRGVTYEQKMKAGLEELVTPEFADAISTLVDSQWPDDVEPQKTKRAKNGHRT